MKKTICIFGVAISIVIIVLGIQTYMSATNFSVKSGMKFGADFYTEIFEEVEQIKMSVRSIDNTINRVGGLVLISSGGLSLCYFMNAIFSSTKKKNKIIENVKNTENTEIR